MGTDDTDLEYGALIADDDLYDALYEEDFEDAGTDHEPDTPDLEREEPDEPTETEVQMENEPLEEPTPTEAPVEIESTEPVPATPSKVDPQGRPLVAVCGTGGAAGTTTVTALMAFVASRQNEGPVLLTDLGGPSASLAAYLGKRAVYSLGSAANAHKAGVFAGNGKRPFVNVEKHLRLMAKEPDALDLTTGDENEALRELLIDAQDDHFATFIDCGRLELDAERQVASEATHIVWVSGGEVAQARQARAKVTSLGFQGSKFNLLFVTNNNGSAPDLPAQEEFGRLADEASLAIVLSPKVGDLVEQGLQPTASRGIKPLRAALERILA